MTDTTEDDDSKARIIESVDELEDGETYHYVGTPDGRKSTFTVDLRHADADDFAGYGEGSIQFQYRDGYVADLPVSNVERDIGEGKIARGEA